MENRALGKGLSALIPDNIKELRSGALTNLKPSQIDDNLMQPRSVYDDNKLAELKASIKEKGVLQPILVRKKGEKYEVIAGERRLRAARALNLETVPAIVKDVNDEEALVLALIENIQREELNAIEEAQAYERLVNQFQFTHDAVAQSVGKDRSTVSNLLRLLKLPEFIQKGIFDQIISMGHARALLSVENSAEQIEYFETTVKKGLSVRGLENLINSSQKKNSRRKKADALARGQEVVALEEELQKALGTRVHLQARKKRGKIIIEYYSLEDLERILKIISKGKAHLAQ